jgi:hypothetical protein
MLDQIRRSIAIYRSNGLFFAGYAAWLLLPYAGLILAQLIPDETISDLIMLLLALTMFLLDLWVATIMVRGARDILLGRPVNTQELIASSTERFRSVVFVDVLIMLIVLGGFILLIIPGLVFAVWYALSTHAAMLDDKHGMEALTASRELVRGKFWSVAWKFFGGLLLINFGYYVPLSILMLIIASATGTPVDALFGDNPPLWSDVMVTIADVFMLPVTTIYLTQVYLETKNAYVRTDRGT